MNKEEFVNFIRSRKNINKTDDSGLNETRFYRDEKTFYTDCFISNIYIGGMEGGNCWGDEAELKEVSLTDDDFKSFFESINNIFYKILSIDKNLQNNYSFENIKHFTKIHKVNEFYGNNSTYLVFIFMYEDIYDHFQKYLSNMCFT